MNVQWDLEKVVLVVVAAGIVGGLGFMFYERSVTRGLLDKQHTAEEQLARVGERAQQIHALKDEIRRDPVAKGTRAFEYLENQMVESRIGKKFAIDGTRSPKVYQGYSDTVYGLTPEDSRETFSRSAIGTFLLYIEANTNRMKITRIRLEAADKKGGVIDSWKPTLEVTDRQASATS